MPTATWAQESLAVSRMKVRGSRLDPLLCRQRLSRLLDEADITLDGFPRSAIVCLRRVRTTVDDGLLSTSSMRGGREGWKRQIRTSLDQVARHAYRPARDVVPTTTDAVWFADQAELLACLAHDWCTGTASLHWWWKSIFRGGDYVKAILDSWREFPQYIPGTLLHLANNGKVVPFVRMVGASDTQTVLDRMMSVFALPELRAAIGTEVWSNYDSGVEHVVVQEAVSTRIPQPAPWQRWIAEGQGSDLGVKQQCLIGIGLMLHRAPSVVRTSHFAQALAEWTRRPVKQLPSIVEQIQERPREARQAERQTLNPRFKPPIIPAQADDHALCPANVPEATESSSVDAPPIDSDVQPLAGQRTSIPSLSCVAADPREIGGERKTIAADSIVEGVSLVEGATPTQRLIPQAHAEQHSLSRRQTAPLQARSAGSETESTAFLLAEASIDTAFGGVFYLMNLALYLKLYGDFSTPLQPGIALSPWDFLALVSEQLVGKRIHADPDIQQHDLNDHGGETRGAGGVAASLVLAFQVVVDLRRSLAQQKQPADDQHEVADGDVELRDREQRVGQCRDPGDRSEQRQPSDQGQRQPDLSATGLSLRRQAARHDRDENDVVDAEHDFERCQRQKARPGLGICEEF
jgi:hypothetical protein